MVIYKSGVLNLPISYKKEIVISGFWPDHLILQKNQITNLYLVKMTNI